MHHFSKRLQFLGSVVTKPSVFYIPNTTLCSTVEKYACYSYRRTAACHAGAGPIFWLVHKKFLCFRFPSVANKNAPSVKFVKQINAAFSLLSPFY